MNVKKGVALGIDHSSEKLIFYVTSKIHIPCIIIIYNTVLQCLNTNIPQMSLVCKTINVETILK